MATVLLFNIQPEKLTGIKIAALVSGVTAKVIPSEHYGLPLGTLAGNTVPALLPAPGAIPEEMLIMCGLTSAQMNQFLDRLRETGCTVPLKAVLTETNSAWSPLKLFPELRAEHAAMQRYAAAKKQPRHHKKK